MPKRRCSVDGCEYRARTRGWCTSHYERWRLTGSVEGDEPMREVRRRLKSKVCVTCKVDRSLDFYPSSPTYVGRCCRYCVRTRTARRLQTKFDESFRALNIRKYGMRLPDLESLLLFQAQRCRICWTSEPAGKGSFHVDHCHETGRVRGLLCGRCNVGLGMFRESPGLMAAATEYLSG